MNQIFIVRFFYNKKKNEINFIRHPNGCFFVLLKFTGKIIIGEVMIVCTSNDKDFAYYKDSINNRKVLFFIKDIFKDHWEDYKIKFSNRKRRPIIDKVIDKFLLCKSFLLGYSLYECPNCNKENVVPHTCKTSFCSSCGNKYNEDRAISIFSKLFKWKHRHVVFTVPEELRPFFRNNRSLLNLLFEASSITVKCWFLLLSFFS